MTDDDVCREFRGQGIQGAAGIQGTVYLFVMGHSNAHSFISMPRMTVGGGVTTRFLYDGDALVAEYNASGTLLRRYVHGSGVDEPILWYEGATLGTRRALQADHQGSIIGVANSSGTSFAINAYDPWGIPNATNQGRFQYTGQAWLPELGMYHYKARIYSPTLGRFLQTDPIGYEDQVNLYAYVANDPVNLVDPDGKQAAMAACVLGPVGCAGGAIVSAATVIVGVAAIANPPKQPESRQSESTTQSTSSRSESRRQEQFVVRVQAQGTGLKAESSAVISQKTPVTAGQVQSALGQVTNQLTRSEQSAMAPGVAAASRFTNAAAAAGGVDAPVSKSFSVSNDVPRSEMRIDIEVISGHRNIIPD